MKKVGKAAKFYVVGTQGLLTMFVLCVLGFFIGRKIKEDSVLPPLLAVFGVLTGLVTMITHLLFLIKEEGRNNGTKE